MIFYSEFQCDRDKQADTQAFFAHMTDEQITSEIPDNVKLVGRWHDIPNGSGIAIFETDDQDAMLGWMMGWSAFCTFPVLKPVVDDATGRAIIKGMMAAQAG